MSEGSARTGAGLVIVDYGAGNLRSVSKAFEHIGAPGLVTSSPAAVAEARMLVLPGVGAAADTMNSLDRLGLVEPIKRFIASGRPFFGVCLGLQVLLDGSEEGGWQPCLGVFAGRVRKFDTTTGGAALADPNRLPGSAQQAGNVPAPALKVPHMGWNQVHQRVSHPVFAGVPDGANFYFVHSYYAQPDDPAVIAGVTDYGLVFPSVLARDNVVATQFHPEKSADDGLQLYASFVRWASTVG